MTPAYVVYFAAGACSRVTLTALEQAQAAYEVRALQLASGEQRQEAYLALNPKGKVPLLITPAGPLSENLAIVSYLNECHPQAALLPSASAYDKATAMSWLSWCATALHPLIYRMRMSARIHPDARAHDAIKAAACQELDGQLMVAERHLAAGNAWLCGSTWCMADIYLLWAWQRALQSGYRPPRDMTALDDWGERCNAVAPWQRAIQRES